MNSQPRSAQLVVDAAVRLISRSVAGAADGTTVGVEDAGEAVGVEVAGEAEGVVLGALVMALRTKVIVSALSVRSSQWMNM